MAREDVNIKVSANVAEAIRLWKAMEEGPQQMANTLDSMGQRGKKAGGEIASGMSAAIGQWTSLAASITAAKQILDAYLASQREHAKLVSGSTVSADTMSRELFQLTSGGIGLKQIQQDMLRLAQERRVTPEQAKETVAALLGAGYDYNATVKPGGAADAMLRSLAATNAVGGNVDTKGLTDAVTAHLEATEQSKSPQSILAAGQAIQGLFAGTKLEMTDLQALAPRAATIFEATRLGNEQLAILSQFKDVTSAERGSTAFATAVGRLQGAGGIRERERALQSIGLQPTDVDFIGESFFDVQQRMARALTTADPVVAAQAKNRIFGQEGILAADVLFTPGGVQQTRERLGMSADLESFNRAATIAEGGFEAKKRAAEAREMAAHLADEGFVDPELARKAFMTQMQERGVSGVARLTGQAAFDAAMYITNDAESAIYAGIAATTEGTNRNRGILQQQITDAARADTIRIELTDQNGVAIPHKSEVNNVGKNRAGSR